MQTQSEENERILAEVEAAGVGYVRDAEVFAVTLMDAVPNDELAESLCALVGVQQMEINSSRLVFNTVRSLAQIPHLRSLVLSHASLTNAETALIASLVPELVLVDE